jgi:ATP-dependent DNA helicase RecG
MAARAAQALTVKERLQVLYPDAIEAGLVKTPRVPGLIEKWGRGTNRVAEMCKAAGVAPPEFTEIGGAAVVTFRADVGQTRRPESQLESRLESQLESRLESRKGSQPKASEGALETRVLGLLENGALSRSELSRLIGQRRVSGQLHVTIKSLLSQGLIAYTVPQKPGSRLQKYRLVKSAFGAG